VEDLLFPCHRIVLVSTIDRHPPIRSPEVLEFAGHLDAVAGIQSAVFD